MHVCQALERPLLADFVEEVATWFFCGLSRLVSLIGLAASDRHRLRHRDELGQLSEVLGGGCEVELIAGAIRSS